MKTTQPSRFASQMQRDWTSTLTRPSFQWPCGQSTSGQAAGLALGPIEVAGRVKPGRVSSTTFSIV